MSIERAVFTAPFGNVVALHHDNVYAEVARLAVEAYYGYHGSMSIGVCRDP